MQGPKSEHREYYFIAISIISVLLMSAFRNRHKHTNAWLNINMGMLSSRYRFWRTIYYVIIHVNLIILRLAQSCMVWPRLPLQTKANMTVLSGPQILASFSFTSTMQFSFCISHFAQGFFLILMLLPRSSKDVSLLSFDMSCYDTFLGMFTFFGIFHQLGLPRHYW